MESAQFFVPNCSIPQKHIPFAHLLAHMKQETPGDPIQWSEKEIQLFDRKNKQLMDALQKSASPNERSNRAGQKQLLESISHRKL